MTIIRDLIDIEKIWSKSKKTPCDIAEFLEDDYYSASKKKPIKNGDMHLTHYVRRQLRDEKRDDEIINRISKENAKLKQGLRDYKKAMEKLKPIITQLGRL